MNYFGHGVTAIDAERKTLYTPIVRPGFVAWVTAFDYNDGRIGISFKETIRAKNPDYVPAKLEMGEAVGAPVSYGSVECGDAEQYSFRVYMVSNDNGATFTETGRCQLEQGSFCNAGFPNGRILGMDVPRINEERTGWCDYIEVRESLDGGNTWRHVTRLLEGCAPYLWRSRRLRDGSILLLASLYGTPWGPGRPRATRNTMLPGETYIHKIQTFFMITKDGYTFSGPHYVLPDTGAHEYDVVECADDRLLFIAGDVQGTPVARQFVERRGDSYINGTLYPIKRGAPADPAQDMQGGFVPESLVMLSDGLLVGSRRNKPYSCSNDYGENWYELDNLKPSLYQPFMLLLPNDSIINFGHYGGDAALGQHDMWLGADYFTVENRLPKSCSLSLIRQLSQDSSHYTNAYTATLTAKEQPVAGQTLIFRFTPVWNPDGSYCSRPQSEAPIQLFAVTDSNGTASVHAAMFDDHPDIHYYYTVDVVFSPTAGSDLQACNGPLRVEAALTPHRSCRYPYPAYFAEGTLYIAPALYEQLPDLDDILKPYTGSNGLPPDKLNKDILSLFLSCGILRSENDVITWLPSVHASCPLKETKKMGGDWYI